MPRFADKTVLITGASSGIGRAAAVCFAQEGARLVLVARREQQNIATLAAVQAAGAEAIAVQADVSLARDCEAMIAHALAAFGKLDIAFNNAGVALSGGLLADETEANWDITMAVNLKGVFLSMKYEIPAMLAAGGGAIINNSSIGGLVGSAGLAAYHAAKHGVIGLSKAAAIEYAQQGIRVNAICPGVTRSEMTDQWLQTPGVEAQQIALHPLGRVATAEEIAKAVLFLASGDASFVTGHALAVDGGYLAQ